MTSQPKAEIARRKRLTWDRLLAGILLTSGALLWHNSLRLS